MFSADLKKINFQLKINVIMKTEFEQNEKEALNKTDVSGSVDISNKEYKNLMKVLYPKNNSKKFKKN